MVQQRAKRFAVLLCADDSEYVKKSYGGYLGVFLRLLGEEGETWEGYRVKHNEFPNDKEIDEVDGFVITGSCNDAHGDEDWILELILLVRKLNLLKKKILGVCFGHQVLCRALGGEIGRAASGWSVGITTLNLSLSSSELLKSLNMPTTLPVIEIHQDEVWNVPPKAEVIAWSDETKVEMFKYGDHIMGIQGHPEYTKDILQNLINCLVERNVLEKSIAETARENMEARGLESEAWKRICIGFLKSRL